MLLLAGVTIPLAQAQLTYTYQGKPLKKGNAVSGESFRGQVIQAELVTDEPIPADPTSPPDYSTALACPTTWKFTITVGSTVYDSQHAHRTTCYYLGNTGSGNAMLPAFLFFGIQQGDDFGGTEAYICSHVHHRTFDPIPCKAPFRGSDGQGGWSRRCRRDPAMAGFPLGCHSLHRG